MPIDPINNSPKYRKALPKLDEPQTDRFAGMYGGNPNNYNPNYTNTGENKNPYQPNWNEGVSHDVPANYNRENYLQPFKENPDFYDRPKLTNPEEQTIYQKMGKGLKNLGNNMWDNRSDIAQGLLYGADMLASNKNEYRQDMAYENAFRNRMQQDPLWDYNAMYGSNQPLIKAEEGAQVRKPGVQGMPIEIEGGEFLILPDGTAELARGPKHKNGGIPTILPDKSIVYSNKLMPHGSKETFAKIAKKQDFTTELKTLQNPFASEVAKNSAQRMYDRKRKTLSEIFQMQQIMNGNSSGQPKGMSQENEGSEQPPMNPNEAQTTMQNQPHGDMMARGGLIEQEFQPVYTSNPNDPRFSNYPGEVLYGMGGPYYEPYNIQYGMGGMTNSYSEGGVIDASIMKLVEFKDGGMYINPKNKGKFTAWAQSNGMSVQEAASHVMANKENYSPTTVKRANFAKNASTFKHEKGGIIQPGKTYNRIGKKNSYMFEEGGTTTQDQSLQAFDFIRNQGQKPAVQNQNEEMIMGPDYITHPSLMYKPMAVPPAYVKPYTTKNPKDWTEEDKKQYTFDFYNGNNPLGKSYYEPLKNTFGDLKYNDYPNQTIVNKYKEEIYNLPEFQKVKDDFLKKDDFYKSRNFKSYDDLTNWFNNGNLTDDEVAQYRRIEQGLNNHLSKIALEKNYYPSVQGVPYSEINAEKYFNYDPNNSYMRKTPLKTFYNQDIGRDNAMLINDTKQRYFNYLDSPAYIETAKKMWGDDYQKHIDEQKMKVQNVGIVFGNNFNDTETGTIQKMGQRGAYASYNTLDNKVYAPDKQWRVPGGLHHEISHSTDSGYYVPEDFVIAPAANGKTEQINPKYFFQTDEKDNEMTKIAPSYEKWYQKFPDQPETATPKEKYYKRATEVRARVNALRTHMSENGFNWNRATEQELMDYLNNIKDPALKMQFQDLIESDKAALDGTSLLDLFQNYAANEKKTDTRYAANGGLIREYAEGGVYDMDDQEIERLRKLGYEIEIG